MPQTEKPFFTRDARLGNLPADWSICELKQIADVRRGKFTPRPRNDPRFYNGEHPFVQTGDITSADGARLSTFSQTLNELGTTVSREFPVDTIAVTIAANIADTAILARPMYFPDSIVGVIVQPPNCPRYVELCIRTAKPRLEARAPQTAQKNLNLGVLVSLRFPLPQPDEQWGIAGIHDAVDAAIERTRTAIEKARRVKKSLVQTVFTRGIGHTQFQPTALGQIPCKWRVVSVGDVLTEAQYGLSMPMHQQGRYPILRMAAIQDGNILLGDLKYVDLSERVAADYLLGRGDILFNRTNSSDLVGKVGVYRSDEPAVFASYLIRLKTNPALMDNYFLGQLLSSYPAQCRIKRYATPGVQQVNINATNLQRVQIAIPVGIDGLKEQRAIAEILERQDDCIRQLAGRVDLLVRLKRGLMQDLLTGRKRIQKRE